MGGIKIRLPNHKGIKFMFANFKLIIHLLLKTKRFGVNNQWHSSFESTILGSWAKREILINLLKVKPVIQNYRLAKYRATALGFLHPQICWDLGWRTRDLEIVLHNEGK